MRIRLAISLCGLVLVMTGCGGGRSGGTRHADIVRFPKWDYRPYERLATLAIRYRDPRAAAAADQASRRLEHLLYDNGAFTLVSREDLRDVFTEHDLSQLAGVADPATVIPPGQIQIAQALVVGEISDFDVRAERFDKLEPVVVTRSYRRSHPARHDPRYGRHTHGGTAMTVQQVPRVYYRHSARVGGTLRVIDLATGRVLLSHSVAPIECEDERRDRPPDLSPEDCAARAAEQLASAFYRALAPIRMNVKVDRDSLGVALDYYDGKYDETTDIPADAEQILLFVRKLPRELEQNAFRITVVPRDARTELYSESFVWNEASPARGMQFPVALDALDGAEFTVKLYSEGSDAPMLTRDFRIVPVE